MKQIITYTSDETEYAGKELSKKLKPGDVISMTGPIGSGKSVMTRGIARGLEINDNITSPTFTLICEYNGKIPLYHMDLYRISDSEEFEMIGGRDLIYSNGISVIEWAEKIKEYLPENMIHINIDIEHDGSRKITIQGTEQ